MNPVIRHRKISPNEWLYLSSARHFPPFAIQLLIAADTMPSQQTMRAAVASAAAHNPGARLVRQGAWWVDCGALPAVRHLPPAEIFSLTHPAVHAALPMDGATPLEIICWEGAGLLFRCAHALMDAGGLRFFAEEVFRALRGEALLGSTAAQSDRDYVLALKHPAARKSLKPNRPSPLGPPARGQAGFVWERRTLPGKVTATAARLASAITQLAAPDEAGTTAHRFMFPVDLRNVDRSMRTTCNFSNPIFLDVAGPVPWTAVYARTLEAFAAHEERATSRLDAIAPWLPLTMLGRVNRWEHEREVRHDRHLFSALLSDIGAISLDALSAPAFKPHSALFLPFDAPGSALTLITVQHDHGLEIAASCPAATGQDGKLARALDLLCAHLQPASSRAAKEEVAPPQRPANRVKGPQLALPAHLSVCTLISDHAVAAPERVALVDGERRLRYGELLLLANAGAIRLETMGVAPGDKVAILAERSCETIVAILAIFAAGAAFVPIDPDWPEERRRFVLADCRPRCAIVEDRLAAPDSTCPILTLSALCAPAAENERQKAMPPQASLAYVLYTSGSTGEPKGVQVGHESLLNYVLWSNEAYLKDLGTPCVFPFFTSLAFDLTLTSLFLPLTTGGEIHVFRKADPLAAIAAILADPAINAVKLTPSHLWIFWGAGMAGSAIRKLIVGGEALPVSLAKEVCEQRGHQVDIYNEYGPTEATVGCVVHRYDASRDRDTFVPIGLPIANTEVMLLDERGRPVPDGTIGEIALAGRCLALGYLERPEEDGRFGLHPFEPGARAYRTGDAGVCRIDGIFDYRGRVDEQVKIRGHRIELGEVEAAIERTALCSAFAVVAETSAGCTRLAAHVVWRAGAGEDTLRRALSATLPGYMIPARVVAMEALPLNVNGKIDKRVLRAMSPGAPRAESAYPDSFAAGDMETQLAEIVAGMDSGFADMPRNQSLLELGLDSLQMMLLLTLAARQFLPASARSTLLAGLADFLRAPTIVNLAAHLRRAA
jgi:amino acid adenylation domain-containing protein